MTQAEPHTDAERQVDLDRQVTEDVGGVQGTSPQDEDAQGGTTVSGPGGAEDAPTPDAGEIEWAGQVVKKPPHPA